MAQETQPSVLVIDDDPMIAETLAKVLTMSGFRATAVFSGERGLELARETHFDHLVSDVMMDGMNGIDAAIAIRQILPACRILLISGNIHTSELLAAATAQGHNFDILAKPVHPSILLEQMRTQSLPGQSAGLAAG